MVRIDIKIPIQLALLSFSLKNNMPNKLEVITIPILTIANTIELLKIDASKALKKNTRQKKLGTPNITPQNRFFILKKIVSCGCFK